MVQYRAAVFAQTGLGDACLASFTHMIFGLLTEHVNIGIRGSNKGSFGIQGL